MIGLKAWRGLAAWMIGAMWCFGQPGIYGGGRADSVMRCETDDFLRNMPPGLQARQEKAVRMAVAGNSAALDEVRFSRNHAMEIAEGVEVMDIDTDYRLYKPAYCNGKILPVMIYLHGGGWCFGSINSCARFCIELVKTAGIAVLAVDYPLAPEHPYPAALVSCTDVVGFVFRHAAEYGLDSDGISIGGDSAGGNLALATALSLIDSDKKKSGGVDAAMGLPRLKSLVLFYPVTKVWNDQSASWREFGNGFGLDSGLMEAFNEAYLNGVDANHPLVSPFNAQMGCLAMLPPVLIINAERDILRDQGRDMADKLTDAGVWVRRIVLPGTTHLFITVPGQPTAFAEAVRATASFLNHTDADNCK